MSLSTSFPLASRQWQRQSLASVLGSFLDGVVLTVSMHVEQKFWYSSLDSSEKKKTKISPATRTRTLFWRTWTLFWTNGISPFMEILIITPRPRTLFHTKSPRFQLGNGATPAGRGWYRRPDLVRLGRTENPSKSQLSHFLENDNKWIRLQHHVLSPLEQKKTNVAGEVERNFISRPLFVSGTRTIWSSDGNIGPVNHSNNTGEPVCCAETFHNILQVLSTQPSDDSLSHFAAQGIAHFLENHMGSGARKIEAIADGPECFLVPKPNGHKQLFFKQATLSLPGQSPTCTNPRSVPNCWTISSTVPQNNLKWLWKSSTTSRGTVVRK